MKERDAVMGEGTWTCGLVEKRSDWEPHVCICPILRRPSYVHGYNHTFTNPAAPTDVCVTLKGEHTHTIHWRSVGGLRVTVRQIITSLTSHEKDLHSALLLFYLPASVCRSDQVINGFVFKCSQHHGERGVFV